MRDLSYEMVSDMCSTSIVLAGMVRAVVSELRIAGIAGRVPNCFIRCARMS